MLKQAPAFVMTGLLNTAVGYAVYAALVLAGLQPWSAVVGAMAFGLAFNFFSYGNMVFGNGQVSRLPRFIALYAAIALLNTALLDVLARHGVGPLLAQALLLPFLSIVGYIGMRQVVFRANTDR